MADASSRNALRGGSIFLPRRAEADPRTPETFLAYILERVAAEAAAQKHKAPSNLNYFRSSGFQNQRPLSAVEELVMVKALLRRAIKLAGALTPSTNTPAYEWRNSIRIGSLIYVDL